MSHLVARTVLPGAAPGSTVRARPTDKNRMVLPTSVRTFSEVEHRLYPGSGMEL